MPLSRPQAAVWFEIPTVDFERAIAFYEALFGVTLHRQARGPAISLAVFPAERSCLSGCLMKAPHLRPSTEGTLVYLNADGRLEDLLKRTRPLGGRIDLEEVELPGGLGRVAHIIDSEGNRIGLHSPL